MRTVLAIFVLSFVLALGLTRLMISMSLRLKIVDSPDGYRKSHKDPIPRLGGPAVFFAFFLPLILIMLGSGFTLVAMPLLVEIAKIRALFVCSILVLLLGCVDDVMDIRPRWKLAWQIAIASFAYFMSFSINSITNPFGGTIILGAMSFPVTVFWFVACMNAVNLIDGIDGLAAGTVLFVGLTMFLVSMFFENTLGMALMAGLSGSVLGFLVFNFPPARIFLGDSGSLLLGFFIAALSLIGATYKAGAAVALFIPVVALGLPIIDTAMAILRRWFHRVPISAPDRGHIHHFLVSMGYSPRRAVLILYLISVMMGFAALIVTIGKSHMVVFVMIALMVVSYASLRLFTGLCLRDIVRRLLEGQIRRRNSAEARVFVARAMAMSDQAVDLPQLWGILTGAFMSLRCDEASLELDCGGGGTSLIWRRDEGIPVPRDDIWEAKLDLVCSGRKVGILKVTKCVASEPMPDELPDLVDRIRHALACKLDRMAASGWHVL